MHPPRSASDATVQVWNATSGLPVGFTIVTLPGGEIAVFDAVTCIPPPDRRSRPEGVRARGVDLIVWRGCEPCEDARRFDCRRLSGRRRKSIGS